MCMSASLVLLGNGSVVCRFSYLLYLLVSASLSLLNKGLFRMKWLLSAR
ncbi:hypothetical protein CIPAW_07G223600 [Carya illinoinensis]|uniref:Uncharacterized protein n=1 Tax=Carya illinoinensis TaxID=32201 RepID=A0A8T1Q5C2_CARIL|nr:hypothetical protein CIPAW_07G223600 [Carya illinoinensis]